MASLRYLLGPLLFVALLIPTAASAALTTSHLATDAEMLAVLNNIVFVAEGRIGDQGGAATFELDLGQDTGAPVVQKQHTWPNGIAEPFTLSYDAGANLVTFDIGGKFLQYTPGPNFDLIVVRTRATQDLTSCVVGNMVLDGMPVGDQSSASGPDPGGLDNLLIEGGELEDGFILTGDATLTWGGDRPRNSHLAFQIKVGSHEGTVQLEDSTWGKLKSLYR
jgi:hypothetical protein